MRVKVLYIGWPTSDDRVLDEVELSSDRYPVMHRADGVESGIVGMLMLLRVESEGLVTGDLSMIAPPMGGAMDPTGFSIEPDFDQIVGVYRDDYGRQHMSARLRGAHLGTSPVWHDWVIT